MSLNQAQPVDALIIDASALQTVDAAWTADAFRRGVTIVGINVYGSDFRKLVSLPDCFGSKAGRRLEKNFFGMKTHVVLAEDPTEGAAALAQLNQCSETETSSKHALVEADDTTKSEFKTEEDYILLKAALFIQLNSTARIKYEFANGFYTGSKQ